MPIPVECKQFNPPLHPLNGTQILSCSKRKLLLSALTCGYDGFFNNFGSNWLKRLIHVFGSVYPFITTNNSGNLCLDSYYILNDDSENTQGIYYIAQALTKLFAQQFLAAPLVIHASKCSWVAASGNAGKVPHRVLGRQKADLFAFGQGSVHVLESKGRAIKDGSGALSQSAFNSALNDALVQVSAVQNVNGRPPVSRCACVWTLCTSGIKGSVVDPTGQGWNVFVGDREIVQGNYALFSEAPASSFLDSLLPGFSMLRLETSYGRSMYIGIISRLLAQIRLGTATASSVMSLGSDQLDRFGPPPDADLMSDGTVLYTPDNIDLGEQISVK